MAGTDCNGEEPRLALHSRNRSLNSRRVCLNRAKPEKNKTHTFAYYIGTRLLALPDH